VSVAASGTARVPDGGLVILLPRQESRDIHSETGRVASDTSGGSRRSIRIVP
jgi:hypothetical protein